jgi:hypothetical protein
VFELDAKAKQAIEDSRNGFQEEMSKQQLKVSIAHKCILFILQA